MRRLKSKWHLLAVVLGLTASLVAFGVALAATVQVSRDIPSTLTVVEVDVLAAENLVISHDPEGNDPITSFQMEVLNFQPPLSPIFHEANFYIRNDSGIDLTLVEPCGEFTDPSTGFFIGSGQAAYADAVPNDTCTGVAILSGETLRGWFEMDVVPELPAGDHSFTLVFGAIGEQAAP